MKIKLDVNNRGVIELAQKCRDGDIKVERYTEGEDGSKEWDCEYVISAGDFVMLLNYYKNQKDADLPIF